MAGLSKCAVIHEGGAGGSSPGGTFNKVTHRGDLSGQSTQV